MKTRGKIQIGCSGWNYPHWKGRFYPRRLSPSEWFDYYAGSFKTVEINNTFYRLPRASVFQKWHDQAPVGFVFSVKVSRFLTHLKKLRDVEDPLNRFLKRVRLLKEHLGPLLYQLPPHWSLNFERLESFLQLVPPDLEHVFEFRDQSWLNARVFRLLKKHEVSLCLHDLPGLKIDRQAIGPLAYVRFHGAARKYRHGYPDATLREWLHWMEAELKRGKKVYGYFNNDAEAHAVRDAQRLRSWTI